MKYVILQKAGEFDRVCMGFAPQKHTDIAAGAIAVGFKPVSAGFVKFHETHCVAFGRSESLQIDSRPTDSVLIHTFRKASDKQEAA
jgi:hypothetical protein